MGDSAMIARQTGDQSQLFSLFNREERIPARHLRRRINPIVTRVLADLREKLRPIPVCPSCGGHAPTAERTMTRQIPHTREAYRIV
jgi:hypothetical protein